MPKKTTEIRVPRSQQIKDAVLMSLTLNQHRWLSRKDLIANLAMSGYKVGDRKLRDVINGLRKERNLIVSDCSSSGYKLADSLAEVIQCVNQEFDAKARDMLFTRRVMRNEAFRVFGGQMSLPGQGRQ